ncbi:MAG TPA: pseudouridine synthase [Candidatus Saccharimonadales bacterium]
MRINKFIASSLGVSRRQADAMIAAGRVAIDGQPAELGRTVGDDNLVTLDGKPLAPAAKIYILLNKPVGYVSSRRGQGAETVYSLLPDDFRTLKSAGRLDKNSSGVLLMSNDGDFAQQMTHPKYKKSKEYEISLDKELKDVDKQVIEDGVDIGDGQSRLKFAGGEGKDWQVTLSEGRNRQIRRTFAALGYEVERLHRTRFGSYGLEGLESGEFKQVDKR